MAFSFLKRKSGTISPTPMAEPVLIPQPAETLPPKQDFRAAGASRDAFIVGLVQRFGLLTSDLIQQRVALEQFEGLTSSHNVLNRLKILTQRKEIYNLGRAHSGHVVYGAKPARGNARRHIAHDLGVARYGTTLEAVAKERGVSLKNWCCEQSILRQECKSSERPFVPDARFIFNSMPHFLEHHTGSQGDEVIISKLHTYKKYQAQLRELSKIDPNISAHMRVLFTCQRHEDVDKVVHTIQNNYDGMLFWVGWEGAYFGKPEEILAAIWKVGTGDDALHGLLEARERE